MPQSSYFTFPTGQQSQAIYLDPSDDLEVIFDLECLKAAWGRPTLVLIGGASGLSEADALLLTPLFRDIICPLAETQGLTVIDGGTNAGIMNLIGQAYQEQSCSFPLIGVVVHCKARLPNAEEHAQDAADLEPNHTHFLFVPGQEWGDESLWLAQLATILSAEQVSATVLINGGAISLYQDVPNSLQFNRPVLVLAGTGRSADRLAEGVKTVAEGGTVEIHDANIQDFVASELLHIVDVTQGLQQIKSKLQQIFDPPSR